MCRQQLLFLRLLRLLVADQDFETDLAAKQHKSRKK